MHWTQHPEKNKGLYRFDLLSRTVEVLDKTFEFPEDYKFIIDGSPTGGPFPGIRSPWYDDECKRKPNVQAVAMDLDINPAGSNEQYFDPILIRELLANCKVPLWQGDVLIDNDMGKIIEWRPKKPGPLKLWCALDSAGEPRKASYFIGADVSSGSGATPTCFSILDGETGEKIGEYTDSLIEPGPAGALLVALARFFMGARLIWECVGPGIKTGDRVIELQYFNFYTRAPEDSLKSSIKKGLKPGWSPSPAAHKRRLLEDYREALRLRTFVNRSEQALRECAQFRFDDAGQVVHDLEDSKTRSGARASHGDHVIADALAHKLAKLAGVQHRAEKRQEERVPLLSMAWRQQWHDRMREKEEAEV